MAQRFWQCIVALTLLLWITIVIVIPIAQHSQDDQTRAFVTKRLHQIFPEEIPVHSSHAHAHPAHHHTHNAHH
jgi:hypothetical protein